MKKYLGILGLLTVTVIWGGGFVASDMALETLSPFQIMVIRFLIAAVLMTLFGIKQIKTISREEIRCGFWLGRLFSEDSHCRSLHCNIRRLLRMHF